MALSLFDFRTDPPGYPIALCPGRPLVINAEGVGRGVGYLLNKHSRPPDMLVQHLETPDRTEWTRQPRPLYIETFSEGFIRIHSI